MNAYAYPAPKRQLVGYVPPGARLSDIFIDLTPYLPSLFYGERFTLKGTEMR
jgi:hypothetical protein